MQDGYSNMGSALMQKFYFCALNFPPTFFMIIKSVTRQVFFSNQSFEFFFFFFKFCQFSCTKQQHTYQVHRLFSLKCILYLSNHYAVSSLSWNSTTRKILKFLSLFFCFILGAFMVVTSTKLLVYFISMLTCIQIFYLVCSLSSSGFSVNIILTFCAQRVLLFLQCCF